MLQVGQIWPIEGSVLRVGSRRYTGRNLAKSRPWPKLSDALDPLTSVAYHQSIRPRPPVPWPSLGHNYGKGSTAAMAMIELTLVGRPEEGIPNIETAISLNPRHPRIHLFRTLLARAHLDAHHYEEAADQARQTIQRGRVYLDEHLILASALGHLGRGAEDVD